MGEYWGVQYDGELAYLDRELGRLFERMKELGIYDRSLIVVTSDHGEFLGEHSLGGHATYMYEEVLRVPLIIKFPFSSRRGVEKSPLHMVDILPTVFDVARVALPENVSGSPYGLPEKPIVGEFFREDLGVGAHRVMYEGRYKLMHYAHSRNPELYDFKEDASEAQDVSSTTGEVVAALSQKLTEWVENHPSRGEVEGSAVRAPPKDVIEDLKALGYIE